MASPPGFVPTADLVASQLDLPLDMVAVTGPSTGGVGVVTVAATNEPDEIEGSNNEGAK